MPLVPIAAALAPKAGAAMATAFAVGSDDLVHHVHDHATALHEHATAFITLPYPKSRILKMILGPEVAAYNWVHAKADMVWHKLFGGGAVGPDQGRMVEYFAAGCPHCKNMEPVWKEATGLWGQQSSDDAHKVVWQQKQCLDENWKPGPDFKECMADHVQRFPTIKFFAPGSKTGEDFFMERNPEQLVDFAKTGISPDPDVMPRAPDDDSDMKLVDFFAAACPHCKHLDPVWDDAHKQWDKAIGQAPEGEPPREDLPLISFEKKQCYDEHWNPGKDHAECEKFHVDAFPTIKSFMPDPHGHGFKSMNYTGPRTAEGMVKFLKQETRVDDYLKALAESKAAAASHAEPAGLPTEDLKVVDASHHAPGPVGVQVPDEVKHAEQAGGADLAALQGSTPPMEDKALRDFAVEAKPEEPAATPTSGEELPQALKQAVKTAIMPLPVLACLPVRRSRTSPASPRRVLPQAPPAKVAQFI